jgi:hypothetical protein
MKITVEIPDPLFRAAREYCAGHGLSFRQLIESGLRLGIEQPRSSAPFCLKQFGFWAVEQQIHDWSAIREAIYEGRGGAPAPAPIRRRRVR